MSPSVWRASIIRPFGQTMGRKEAKGGEEQMCERERERERREERGERRERERERENGSHDGSSITATVRGNCAHARVQTHTDSRRIAKMFCSFPLSSLSLLSPLLLLSPTMWAEWRFCCYGLFLSVCVRALISAMSGNNLV